MTLPFAASSQSTLGIEWELALVDAATGDLRAEAPDVIAEALQTAGLGPEEEHPHVTAEMLQNTVELVTGVHRTVGSAAEELRGIGMHLLGRRLHETMSYWETADQEPEFPGDEELADVAERGVAASSSRKARTWLW